jgi:hypothetical protein
MVPPGATWVLGIASRKTKSRHSINFSPHHPPYRCRDSPRHTQSLRHPQTPRTRTSNTSQTNKAKISITLEPTLTTSPHRAAGGLNKICQIHAERAGPARASSTITDRPAFPGSASRSLHDRRRQHLCPYRDGGLATTGWAR